MKILMKWKMCKLTAGGLLKVLNGLSLVLLHSFKGSFSNFLVAPLISASDSWMSQWRWGSFTLPVYSHIKPGRRLNGKILQATQHPTRSTLVKPLAIRALSFENDGAYLARSFALSSEGSGCVLLSR